MVSRAEVEDYVRQGKTEAEGYTNIQFENLQKLLKVEFQRSMTVAAATDAKVEALGIESGRAMQLVMAESEKFAAKVATDQAEMDIRAGSFRAAKSALEAQLSEGVSRIKTAQAAADRRRQS